MAHINGNEIYFGIVGTVKGAGQQVKMIGLVKSTVAGYMRTLTEPAQEQSAESAETEG